MAFTIEQVFVGSPAQLIVAANTNAKKRFLKNTGSTVLYIGTDSAVTNNDGFPVRLNETLTFNDYIGSFYGYAATSGSVQIIEHE